MRMSGEDKKLMFKVHPNVEGWGPSTLPEQFLDVPYAPYNKDDRLGKVADFTSSYRNRYNRYDNTSGVNAEFQYKHDTAEDQSFQLVDTIKAQKPKSGGHRQRFQQNRPQQRRQPSHQQPQVRQKGQQQQNKRWDRLNKARRMQGPRRGDNKKSDRVASITVGTDWTLMEQYDLAQLTKLQANAPKGKDVCWAGSLKEFDDSYDRLTTRQDKKLERFDDVDFFYVTTSDDPIIAKEAEKDEKKGEEGVEYVFATDAILATLMAAPRSVYPWDVLITREANRVVFDKTDGDFDLVSVNETAFEPPQFTTPESINNPDKLANEATMINQNFSQQILKKADTKHCKKFATPKPFEHDDGVAGSAYRYREFDLGSNLKLFARTEVNAVVVSRGQEQYATSFALNEWDSKLSGTPEWRQKIDTQRGGVLANELKNNANKLAKWTAQSLVAGVEQMKVGYVSRNSRNDSYNHVILGTHTYKPPEFARQMALNPTNMWGIVKMLAEFFIEQPEGKYVLMKDPNNPFVRIYSLPEENSDDESDE